VCIKYSICGLICGVITCCDTGEINACVKIVFEDQKKRENMEIKKFLHKSPSIRWFWNWIHSLLKQDDARGSVNFIYRIW